MQGVCIYFTDFTPDISSNASRWLARFHEETNLCWKQDTRAQITGLCTFGTINPVLSLFGGAICFVTFWTWTMPPALVLDLWLVAFSLPSLSLLYLLTPTLPTAFATVVAESCLLALCCLIALECTPWLTWKVGTRFKKILKVLGTSSKVKSRCCYRSEWEISQNLILKLSLWKQLWMNRSEVTHQFPKQSNKDSQYSSYLSTSLVAYANCSIVTR